VFGSSWVEVAEVIAGRNNEQCRDRWSDKINRKWTDAEDKSLLEAVETLGSSNWNGVSERLGNRRTDQDVTHLILFQVLLAHICSQCRSRYDKLSQKKVKKPKAPNPGASSMQTSEQPETQTNESGPSSAPVRPRPRPRTRKIPAADTKVTGQGMQQSVERSRPKPRPRAKKSKGTEEEDEVVGSEPISQTMTGQSRGKGKQKATKVASEAKSTRKRRHSGDDTVDNLPSKRKKGDSATIYESANKPKSIATGQATGDVGNCSASHEVAAQNQPGTLQAPAHHGERGTSAEVQGAAKSVRTVEPTRRQPSRAAARKSI